MTKTLLYFLPETTLLTTLYHVLASVDVKSLNGRCTSLLEAVGGKVIMHKPHLTPHISFLVPFSSQL